MDFVGANPVLVVELTDDSETLNGKSEMKIDMVEDEFEKYFARAALNRDLCDELDTEVRRGSFPTVSSNLLVPEQTTVRRTASCKYPSRRRRSNSPRGSSVSPRPRPRSHYAEAAAERNGHATDERYVHETTLRAPSPNAGVKCHSAPHSRSSSWKRSRHPRGSKDVDTLMDNGRPRTGSVPLEDTISKLERLKLLQNEDFCPVRNFAISRKGIENRGDSFKKRSNTSVASDAGSAGSGPLEGGNRSRALSDNSQASGTSVSSSVTLPPAKVLILGDHGVGKTSVIQQFMTSEYMGATDMSFDDENEIQVSVLLDGEETTMDFLDCNKSDNYRSFGEADAYVVVYSMTDRYTFLHAVDMLQDLCRDKERKFAVITVANKSDLVRSRQVTREEGKEICTLFESKYIEVSAGLNHQIDELLVGIVTQIRLAAKRTEKRRKRPDTDKSRDACVKSAKGLIDKLFKKQKDSSTTKSCDNLLVL